MKVRCELVNWVDSCSRSGWKDEDVETSVAFIQSVGFVVSDERDRLALAQSKSAESNSKPWGEIITIPKVCITKRVLLCRVDKTAKCK